LKEQSSISVFKSVIKALVFREIKTRFGNKFSGYFWALLEPIMHVVVLSTIFYIAGRSSVNHIPFAYFIGVSILGWLLFKNVFDKVSNGIISNKGFFSYKQVKIFDVMISRAIVEFLLFGFSVIVLEILLFLFSDVIYSSDFFGFILNSFLLTFLGFSFGILGGILFSFFENSKKIVNIILRMLYFSSGIFYSIDKIPNKYHDYFLYNPIFNLLENLRFYYFTGFQKIQNSEIYVLEWIFLSLFLGLFLLRIFEQKILRS
jgi:capsular polysaccharide transport system permease protein